MFSKIWSKLYEKSLLTEINFSRFMISLMCILGIVYFFTILQNYNNSFVHADYYRYILPESLRDGLEVCWQDVINTLQLRSPGEFRPRFLAYGIQTLDQKLRLYLYHYFPVHPTVAPIAWFLQLVIGPYYLFKGVLNLTQRRQAAIIAVIVYCTSIGFLSGFTMGLLQGKPLANVIFILSFYLMTVINNKMESGKLLYKSSGIDKYILLSVIFFGLFVDEIPMFVFVLLPLMFASRFFIKLNSANNIKSFLINGMFFCIPAFLFLTVVLLIVPPLTIKYFGFEFDYLGNTLALGANTRGAVSIFQGPYASFSFMLVLKNFMTMFGLSLVPRQISQLTLSGYGDYYGGQVNNLAKILIFVFFFGSIGILTRYEKNLKQIFIGFLIAFGLFMLFLSLLLVRHIPIATGYYYGTPFAVLFAILIALYHSATFKFSKMVRLTSMTVILLIIMVQIDNFIPINRGWIKTHNEDIARPSFANKFSLAPPGPVSKTELKNIWKSWKKGELEKYLAENALSSGAIYLVFELKMLDQVKQYGFAKPMDWSSVT